MCAQRIILCMCACKCTCTFNYVQLQAKGQGQYWEANHCGWWSVDSRAVQCHTMYIAVCEWKPLAFWGPLHPKLI